jgi:hypothetical protein
MMLKYNIMYVVTLRVISAFVDYLSMLFKLQRLFIVETVELISKFR